MVVGGVIDSNHANHPTFAVVRLIRAPMENRGLEHPGFP
jgi:hypothetical protein